MIRCIIVDDEPLAREVLEGYIKQSPALKLIKKCSNALEAFDVLHAQPIDLMFLDIQMPAINGIDFLKSLRHPPAVIFTTAFAHYAVTGFELEAIDYLLKPITHERFDKSIQRLLKIHAPKQPDLVKDYSYFKVSGKLVKVHHADLLYAQSVKDYISLKTRQGDFLVHMTMKFLEQSLPANQFVRIHRSYLVNKAAINRVERQQVQIGDELIPVSESYRNNLAVID
jgi:DNA-binding LytR/AlgR family response regulator